MSYLVSDIETASISGGELQSFGLTHSAYAAAPTLDVHVFRESDRGGSGCRYQRSPH